MGHRAFASIAQSRVVIFAAILLVLTAAAPPAPGNLLGINGLTITGAGTWTGVMMFGIYLLREWRETRKLSAEDRLARREGYAKQVENLQVENRRLRGDLSEAEKRHTEYRHACQRETDQMRGEIRGLEDQVTGFKRRLDAQAQTLGRAMLGTIDAPSSSDRLRTDD
jgi:hypothetical protein